ncbi:Coiled-coil domain-containing protein 85C [Eumeta japonica]|uniref:Coiled-coil domain-containing protein 85C n=1 Tax=Eumeta variegata TaxID=151549 RepID=A0A4C1S9J6_EUMVA|nr:Coiled-coil domain-containing protein 85C [Eumeta japonica]
MRSLCTMCRVSLNNRCRNSDVRVWCGLKEDVVARVDIETASDITFARSARVYGLRSGPASPRLAPRESVVFEDALYANDRRAEPAARRHARSPHAPPMTLRDAAPRTMSINQNAPQFKPKPQIGKQSTEVGAATIPPRYQPPPPAARPSSPAAPPGADALHAYVVGKQPLERAKLPYRSLVVDPRPPHLAGPAPPARPLRPPDEVITKALVHEPAEPRARSADDMLKFTKRVEGEGGANAAAGPRASADQRRHVQALLDEVKALKEANRRLSDDNRELRDLCCFLDDDRQKGRKLAREWQRFGRYTASVMRQEVSAYQSKLRELDDKQQELIRDNLELKELCLYLDEERERATCAHCGRAAGRERDDGDGSSGGTNAEEARAPPPAPQPQLAERTAQYVRELEQKVRRLEAEKYGNVGGGSGAMSERPEAVVRALQVLEVRERVERDRRRPAPDLDAGEQALVREMCNVVWGKLEDQPLVPPAHHPPSDDDDDDNEFAHIMNSIKVVCGDAASPTMKEVALKVEC